MPEGREESYSLLDRRDGSQEVLCWGRSRRDNSDFEKNEDICHRSGAAGAIPVITVFLACA